MKVYLRDGVVFEAGSGRTLLDEARAAGVVLNYSCRTGRCGVCRVRVTSGETLALKSEIDLSDADREAGSILTCCRAAASDVSLDAESLDALKGITIRTLPARISAIDKLSTDIVRVRLRLPPNAKFDFVPGQYVDVIGREGIRRSYSMANAPEEGGIELHIRHVDEGTMSAYWFNDAKVNDLLRIEGPLGTFFFRRPETLEDRDILFLATGTGIAPLRAMLVRLAQRELFFEKNRVHLFWGGRTPEDFYWSPTATNNRLIYRSVISRPGGDRSAAPTYVQHVAATTLSNLSRAVVYACGSELMVSSAREHLVKRGLDPAFYYYEAFVSSMELVEGAT